MMERYECDLILDIMPLVRDGVASQATRQALESHLATCESCAEVYAVMPESLPAPEGEAEKTLAKIRRRLTLSAWAAVMAAVALGGFLTMTEHMGYNVILFPLIGMLSFCMMGNRAWKSAGVVTASSFVLLGFRLLTDWAPASASEFLTVVFFSLCYGGAFLGGVAAAWLLRYAFRKPEEKSIKARITRIILGLWAVVLCGGFFYIFDFFMGNPISAAAVDVHAQVYLEAEYPELALETGEIKHDWYSGACYWVQVTSPESPDVEFTLFYDRLGRLTGDSYEYDVLSGRNTFSRISRECEALLEGVEDALEAGNPWSVSFSLASDWGSIYDEFGYPFGPEQRIVMAELEIGGSYDPEALASTYGVLQIWGEAGEISEDELCRILLETRQALDDAGLKIACVDVSVYDGTQSLEIAGFFYDDIGAGDMKQKVHEAVNAWEDFQVAYDRYIAELNQ